MLWWSHLSALGGLNVTVLGALAVAAWLAGARCWRLALEWCLVFGAAIGIAAASQMAFIGWGIGAPSIGFAGFSGHAARAAVLYPAALYLLLERSGARLRTASLALGVLVAAGVAVARVMVGAHAVSEAVLGWLLGTGAALLFVLRAQAVRGPAHRSLLAGLALPLLLLPYAQPVNAQQWITAVALGLSGHDRPYSRSNWGPAEEPYVPPCPSQKLLLGYLCT